MTCFQCDVCVQMCDLLKYGVMVKKLAFIFVFSALSLSLSLSLSLRLGSKLPPGVSQPPQFAKRPWETQPQARVMQEPAASGQRQRQPAAGRPLNHIPHIRNPKLRQYYLQGAPAAAGGGKAAPA